MSKDFQLNKVLSLDCAKIRLTGAISNKFGYESDSLIIIWGAITTPERFSSFQESLCHLMDNGDILRFGTKIGSFEDIEIIGEEENE